MSRIIQQIATVQFQVDNRKVTASMDALQVKAQELNQSIADTNQNIKNLGNVAPDNENLVAYQKQLRQLNSDLKDVTAAQRDLMKGVKAADQLWKAAKTQDIESLSIKAIKAGQNGLRKRMENLRPELGGDEQKMYDAYKAVIDEADRVMNVFKSNYATVVQTIRDGGIVSEQAMKSTRDALRDLMESEKEGTAEHRQLAQQYDFLNESLANVAEMRRREKGEIVNANDARREALKLTEDGIAAARRERDMADATIAGMQQQKNNLDQLRRFHEDRIAQTEREIAANQRLEEAEQDRLADVEKAMRYTENEDRKEAIRLRKKADAARDEAEAKKEAYEEQAEQEKLLRQHVKDTGDEVTNLTAKIEALGKTEAKPKVDTSEIDGVNQKLDKLAAKFKSKAFKMTDEAFEKAFTGKAEDRELAMAQASLQGKLKDKYFFDRRGEAKKSHDDAVAVAKENVRRAIYEEISSGRWSLDDLELQARTQKGYLESLRSMKKTDGVSLQHDAEYQAQKFYNDELQKQLEIARQLGPEMQQFAQAQQQGSAATNDQTEAIKKQEEELGKLEQKLKRLNESRDGYQNDVKESLKAVKDMGLTEEDLADDAKVREAVEKKVLEIMEAQAKVGQEIAEQRKKLAGEVKMSDLGGTKADEKFYAENKDRWDVSDYASPDDMIERIAHLERLKKLKNGKRFNPDEDWEDDDELDEDAPIMNDKERQAIADELRFLKQHIREELLKTIKEVGDIDKAVEQYTGGDGVSEDAKFGEQLNDKISEIKDKIEENIETTLDRYGEMLNEDRDIDSKMTKEQLTKRVSQHMEYVKEDHGVNRSWLEETQGDIDTTKGEIEAKKQLIDQMKQQAQAAKESTQADQQSADVAKQKAELEEKVKEKTKEHTKAVKDYEAQQEKTNKAQEKAYKAQEESVALNEKAATAEEKVAHQEERHAEAMDHQSERLRQIRADGERLLTQYEQQKTEIQAVDKAWADADVKQGEAEARKAQNQELTIKSLDDSIRKLKEANAVIDTNSDEWEENTRIIQRLQAALDEMKNKPALMMMTDRMQDVSKLSTAAVTETRKFWEAMVAGAERGSKELAEYEGHLKTITEEEQKRSRAALEQSAGRLGRTDLGSLSVNELRQSIEDAKRLQATYKETSREAQALAQMIVKAEDYAKTHGVEAVRAANKEKEAIRQREQQEQQLAVQMRQRLMERKTLSADALAETKKYWLAQKNGAEEGTIAFRRAEAALKMLDNVEASRNREANAKKAGILSNQETKLSDYSEGEIREAIEAGKQLILTYKSGSKEATDMAKAIAEAEEHIKRVGLDAQRTAVRQEQAIARIREEGAETVEKAKNGEFATASMDELDKTIKKLKEYQALIKDPNGTGKEAFSKTKEQVDALTEQLNNLKGVAEKVKGTFASADEVLARFGEHVKAGKTSSEDLAKVFDEKLSKAKWEHDDEIEDAIKDVERYEKHIEMATQDLEHAEKVLAELEKKHADSSWLRKKSKAYQEEEAAINAMRHKIEGVDDEDGYIGDKQFLRILQDDKQSAQQRLAELKREKAADLGIKPDTGLADAQRMTNEQMQEGIKLLEEEYRKTDHTTEEGIKRRELLRQKIDQMNQEIKESTGEWMSYAEAEKFAAQAGTEGFIATGQQMKQAQEALERQRDSLIKSIQTKRQEKNMTDEQKKALAAEEAQLDKVNAELKKMKFEMDNTNMSAKRMNEILDNPASAKNIEELGQAVKRAQAQLKVMEDTVGDTNKEYQEMAQKTKEAAQRQKELETQFKASASAFDKAWSRLKTYVGLYVGASVAMNKLVGTMGDLMDLSDKMGEVRKTTGFTADEVGRLSGELKKLDVRTSLVELMEVSAAAGQLGLKTEEDVLGFTEAANKLMIALPEMGKEAATEMMRVAIATGEVNKIRKEMQEGLIDGSSATAVAMEKIASTIDRLRATSAATAPEITDFVKRVGAVGAQSGISIDQVSALGSTVSSLGMRVEMAATALSRMIPAIRNNAFDVAKAIGMVPNELRDMFDEAGGGMNAMLAIFQHIKDSGMEADDIESMLGMGNMKEIMKELNQQGARAGIVFAGLSQNVDELRRQLGVASQAYEENIAVQQEFDKMNETTAAKWERLKNQFEEFFVSDRMQRSLGGIIDLLRNIVDFLSSDGYIATGMRTIIVLIATMRTGIGALIVGGFKKLIEIIMSTNSWMLKLIATMRTMTAAQWGNVFIAAAGALWYMVDALAGANKKADELGRTLAQLEDEEAMAERGINRMRAELEASMVKADAAAKKHKQLKDETEKLRKEVDELKKSTNLTAEETATLTQKEDELKRKEKDLKAATDESNKANKARSGLISEINSKYSSYLGYMLNEADTAVQVANAHMQIVNALREEMKQKGLNRKQDAINDKYEEGIEKAGAASGSALRKLPMDAQQRIKDAFSRMTTRIQYLYDENGAANYRLPAIEGLGNKAITASSYQELQKEIRKMLGTIVKQETVDKGISLGNQTVQKVDRYGNVTLDEKAYSVNEYVNDIFNSFNGWAKQRLEREKELSQAEHEATVEIDEAHKMTVESATKNIEGQFSEINNIVKGNQTLSTENINKLATDVSRIVTSLNKFNGEVKDVEKYVGKDNDVTLENAVSTMFGSLDKKVQQQILKAAQRSTRTSTSTTDLGGANPFGGNAPADSTDYGTWDVNELVARRNQMDKFKNVLKPDTDIRAVLAEDKALMKALDNGLKEDWKSVLGWYNTERKKIQDELKSERFSTNEGHWRDEKQGRGRRNRFRESDYALAELDRYYSKRKEDLEKARIEENMSEELFNRQAELLEQEHLERRSKLRETFTAGSTEQEKKMVKQFREWWDQLEKQGLLDEVPWATVESEWSKALASEIGRNNLRAQQDLTKLQEITVKHLNEIAKLIDKERPYDGITANLRKNLTEMDILLADMQKDGPEKDTAKLVKAETMRLKFLLSEAEQAYSLNFEQLKEKMVKEGFGEWAQAIEGDEQLKQSLMQNLRNTYDAIQEAIKKESSVIKKQLEIQWNDMMPGSEMSMKGMFEKAVSDLGLAGDQVKRANSLIGAGTASDRVADKLAIQQMRIQLQMQETYFALMQKIGRERIKQLEQSAVANEREAKALKEKAELLRKEGKTAEAEVTELKAQNALRQSLQDKFDAEHAAKSLSLARTKELAEEEKQRVAIANQLAESQNRLYTDLRSWADLLTSSLQGVIEASSTADRDYYNERAKLDLTGKGGPGAGTYIVIDNEGTSDARAHYEYLDERQALERQREIENDNAVKDAWKKMLDDLNQKMSDTITDQLNAMLQAENIDKNTQAVIENTRAIYASMGQGGASDFSDASKLKRDKNGMAVDDSGQPIAPIQPAEVEQSGGVPKAPWQMTEDELAKNQENMYGMWQAYKEYGIAAETEKAEALAELPGYTPSPLAITDEQIEATGEKLNALNEKEIEASKVKTDAILANQQKVKQGGLQTDQQMTKSSKASFAAMTAAANMYGIAYQAMSNENLSTTQKVEMMMVQAAGQAAISMLTASMAASTGETAANAPAWMSKFLKDLGPYAGPVAIGVFTALLGGLMGIATSKIAKSKSEIAQATGASMSAGRLSTGMMTYAEGNVNEFTDPNTLTPGRHYNVDGADGRTYRAKYTGTNPRTHITNGPEFHLVGEAGREAIIDAHTTRLMQMDDTGIWNAIQTLYNGGRISQVRRRRSGMGVRAFAGGNLDEFEEMGSEMGAGDSGMGGMGTEQMAAFQQSLDRNSAIMERLEANGIHAYFDVYGRGGLIDSYDQGKKEAQRHGEKY